MNLLKNITVGFVALTTALVTLGTSAAVAQEYDHSDRQSIDGDRDGRDHRDGRDNGGDRGRDGRDNGGDRGRDGRDNGGDRGRNRRAVYLGSTGLVNKGPFTTRQIRVRTGQPFRGLEFVAQDDAFDIRQAVVYFRNGGARNFGSARLAEGGRARIDFQGYRQIDRIVIVGTAPNVFGSRAQLLVYGRP